MSISLPIANYLFGPGFKSKRQKPQESHSTSVPNLVMVAQGPPLVKDRAELNIQSFVIRPKFERKPQKQVDTKLEAEFPRHRDFDFVANHALGFKGKENLDLFKFYYRLFLKNKFTFQRIRKERKDLKESKKTRENKKSEERKQQMNQTDDPNSEELRNAIQEPAVQLNIVRASLKALKQQEVVVSHYVSLPKIATLEKPIPAPTLKVVNLKSDKIPAAKQHDSQLELEQIMLNRVVQAIQDTTNVSPDDLRQVRLIIKRRQKQLTDMERQLQLQQLLQIKKNIYEAQLKPQEQFDESTLPIIPNQTNFMDPSQDFSIIKSIPNRSQANVSVYEYRFNSYGDEPPDFFEQSTIHQEGQYFTQKKDKKKRQKNASQDDTLVVDQESTEMQSILQQRSTSIPTSFDNNVSKEIQRIIQRRQKQLLPTLQLIEEAKVQATQRQSQTDSGKIISEPRLQEELKSQDSKAHEAQHRLVSEEHQILHESSNHSNANHDQRTSSQAEHGNKGMKSVVSQKQLSNKHSVQNEEEIHFDEAPNFMQMKLSNILAQVIEKQRQLMQESYSNVVPPEEQEKVNLIANKLVEQLIPKPKHTSIQVQDSGYFFQVEHSKPKSKHVDADQQEKPSHTKTETSNQRDLSQLDHNFTIKSFLDLNDSHLSEDKIASIVFAVQQQLEQASIPKEVINARLAQIAEALIQPQKKSKTEPLKEKPVIIIPERLAQNHPLQQQGKNSPALNSPKSKDKVDYQKFYEENSKKVSRFHTESQKSIKSLDKMSDQERKQLLDSHRMNLQERPNESEIDEELKYVQEMAMQAKQYSKTQKSQWNMSSSRSPAMIKEQQFEEDQVDVKLTHRSQQPTVSKGGLDPKSQIAGFSNLPSKRSDLSINPGAQMSELQSENHIQLNSEGPSSKQIHLKTQQPSFQQTQQSFQSQPIKQKTGVSLQQLQMNDDAKSKLSEHFSVLEEAQKTNIQGAFSQFQNYDSIKQDDHKSQHTQQSHQSEVIMRNTQNSNFSQKQLISIEVPEKRAEIVVNVFNSPGGVHQLPTPLASNLTFNSAKDLSPQALQNGARSTAQIEESQQPYIQLNSNQQFDSDFGQSPQYARNTNLAQIKLKQYEQQQVAQSPASLNPGGLSPTKSSLRPNGQQAQKARIQFADSKNNSTTTTPLARNMSKPPITKKPSRFQEQVENYEEDYSDDSKKKSRKFSRSSKSTIREDASPVAKASPQKRKIYDLKAEYELIAKRNLSLEQLKRDIEDKIKQIQNPDDEAKYNIILYETRQKAIAALKDQIEAAVAEKREQQEECGDVIKQFHEHRFKYKEMVEKDQTLKFTDQILLDEEQKTQINTKTHLDDYMKEVQARIQRMIQLVQLEQLRDRPELRKEVFDYDTEQLKELKRVKDDPNFVQTQAHQKIYDEQIQNQHSQTIQQEENRVEEKIRVSRMAMYAEKLRRLKQQNPKRFEEIVNTQIYEPQLFIETTEHKFILDDDKH